MQKYLDHLKFNIFYMKNKNVCVLLGFYMINHVKY